MRPLKRFLKPFVVTLLAVGARLVILRYRPKIVMVTGSVGKTSAKDAIAAALETRFFLYRSEKSYNSEFGVPLTIIGASNAWNNPFAWVGVFRDLIALLVLPNHYPKLLILEVGADRPGDLARILRIATPDVVVVTRLPEIPVHVETYSSPQAVREEEFMPAHALLPGTPLILAADDQHAQALAQNVSAKIITYGFTADADVRAEEPHVYLDDGKVAGMEAEIHIGKGTKTLKVQGALGRQHLYAPLAAIAVSEALGVSAKDATEGLLNYAPPPGRERILAGIKNSMLIDGSYNASPAAVEHSLLGLSMLPNVKRRVAILGDMMELGRYSVGEHERIGTLAAGRSDLLITVGIRARATAEAARQAGMKDDQIVTFTSSAEAAEAVPVLLEEGDVVLIKGSQSVRLERVAASLLNDPRDGEKLVRQEQDWRKIA